MVTVLVYTIIPAVLLRPVLLLLRLLLLLLLFELIALDVNLNDVVRSINSRFTYLLAYCLLGENWSAV